jgi:hypothetical protein
MRKTFVAPKLTEQPSLAELTLGLPGISNQPR